MGNFKSTLDSSLMLSVNGSSQQQHYASSNRQATRCPSFHSLGNPLVVRLELVAGQADRLDATLLELWLQLGDVTELGRADRSKVAV